MKSIALCAYVFAMTAILNSAPREVAWTGWFSDERCAAGRAKSGAFTATNPDCAKRCITEGAAPVFISEQAQAIFKIRNYPAAVDDLGYHLEIKATLDEENHTLSIDSVKRLAYEGASCARPKKAGPK